MSKATFEELAVLPGVSSEFICEALEKGWSVDQASTAWMERLAARAAQADQAAAARAAAARPAGYEEEPRRRPGTGGLGNSGRLSGAPATAFDDPVEEFDGKVREKIAAGMAPRAARLLVAKRNPELHVEYLLATQRSSYARRMVEDRADLAGL